MKVNVGVSNRHVHLKKQDLDILFGTDLTIKNKINQPGQFACNEVVTVKTEKSEILSVDQFFICNSENFAECFQFDVCHISFVRLDPRDNIFVHIVYV